MKNGNGLLAALALLAAILSVVFVVVRVRSTRSARPTQTARASAGSTSGRDLPPGLTEEKYQSAKDWFRQRYPSKEPTAVEIFSLAGDFAAAEHDVDIAIACYRAVPSQHPRLGLAARLQEGLLLIQNDRAAEAERALRDYIDAARIATELKPDDVLTAFKWLNFLLSVELRLEDRREFLAELHQIGLADPLDSKQYFFPNLLILNSPAGRTRLKKFLDRDPDNFQLRIAQGRYQTLEGDFQTAAATLEALNVNHDQDVRLAAALAEVYFESNDVDKFAKTVSTLPTYIASEPWLLTRMRGEAASEAKQWDEAIRFFAAVLEQDPANAPSQMGLARSYAASGKPALHMEALRRSAILAEIRVNLSSVQPDAAAAAEELSAKCEAISFSAAAAAFAKHAAAIRQSGQSAVKAPPEQSSP